MSKRFGYRVGIVLVLLALFASACSSDVTESEEYVALASERDDLAAQADALSEELAASEQVASEAEAELEGKADEIEALASRAESAEASLEEAEGTIQEFEAAAAEGEFSGEIAPYPEAVRAEFVEGCEQDLDPSLPEDFCACMVDEIEQSVPLEDFVDLGLEFLSVELDPETGFPTDEAAADMPGINELFLAAIVCTM